MALAFSDAAKDTLTFAADLAKYADAELIVAEAVDGVVMGPKGRTAREHVRAVPPVK
ncbi:MAG: hypothetical protein V2I40_11625 [Desulfobacteraceae bacterium]|nr:hypothetical protein [Desulfobacteraceae bacterium]